MFAIKLTLLIVGITLYVSGTVCWIFWIAPELVMDGETSDLLYAFGGTCAWMLFTFGMIVHIIKTARPAAGGGRRAAGGSYGSRADTRRVPVRQNRGDGRDNAARAPGQAPAQYQPERGMERN